MILKRCTNFSSRMAWAIIKNFEKNASELILYIMSHHLINAVKDKLRSDSVLSNRTAPGEARYTSPWRVFPLV